MVEWKEPEIGVQDNLPELRFQGEWDPQLRERCLAALGQMVSFIGHGENGQAARCMAEAMDLCEIEGDSILRLNVHRSFEVLTRSAHEKSDRLNTFARILQRLGDVQAETVEGVHRIAGDQQETV